jgi:hypothetical protein
VECWDLLFCSLFSSCHHVHMSFVSAFLVINIPDQICAEYVSQAIVGSVLKEESTGEWESRCCLLLWLSILVLIPFDLASVDTSLADSRAADAGLTADDEPPPLVQKMIKICTAHLGNPGPTREMAGVLLSRLLTRPDMRGSLRRYGCFPGL